MNRTRFTHLLVVALASLSSGCLTPKVIDALGDVNTSGTEIVESHFQSLERAVRAGNGTYYLEASYSDGSSWVFACAPVRGVLAPRPLRRSGSVLPRGVPVNLCSPTCMCDDAGVCLAYDGDVLLIREGNRAFQELGIFPLFTEQITRTQTGALLTKLGYLAALPFAVVGDVTLGAAYGLFCTEAGWHLIFAVLTCWAH